MCPLFELPTALFSIYTDRFFRNRVAVGSSRRNMHQSNSDIFEVVFCVQWGHHVLAVHAAPGYGQSRARSVIRSDSLLAFIDTHVLSRKKKAKPMVYVGDIFIYGKS